MKSDLESTALNVSHDGGRCVKGLHTRGGREARSPFGQPCTQQIRIPSIPGRERPAVSNNHLAMQPTPEIESFVSRVVALPPGQSVALNAILQPSIDEEVELLELQTRRPDRHRDSRDACSVYSGRISSRCDSHYTRQSRRRARPISMLSLSCRWTTRLAQGKSVAYGPDLLGYLHRRIFVSAPRLEQRRRCGRVVARLHESSGREGQDFQAR
jgi:hypothetical protein